MIGRWLLVSCKRLDEDEIGAAAVDCATASVSLHMPGPDRATASFNSMSGEPLVLQGCARFGTNSPPEGKIGLMPREARKQCVLRADPRYTGS